MVGKIKERVMATRLQNQRLREITGEPTFRVAASQAR
jgi:CMP-2-keto-3-deoxyoctulosonic acid synthetase